MRYANLAIDLNYQLKYVQNAIVQCLQKFYLQIQNVLQENGLR